MIGTRYVRAAGASLFDCVVVGTRSSGQGPPEESWVLALRRAPPGAPTPLDVGLRLASHAELTGLWRSQAGTTWVCDRSGRVLSTADLWGPGAGQWTEQPLDLSLQGLTGAGEELVVAWGVRRSDGASVFARFNGRAWAPMAGPGFEVLAAAASDRAVWAVGAGGAVGLWDGEGWHIGDAATGQDLVDVCAVDNGAEALAVGRGGAVRALSHGTAQALPDAGVPLTCCAVWGGSVWLGAGDAGLLRLDPGGPEVVRADRRCVSLDAGAHLLVGCSDLVSSTEDGVRFPGAARGVLDQMRAGRSLGDLT